MSPTRQPESGDVSEPLTVLAAETLMFQIKVAFKKKLTAEREYKFHPTRKWRFDVALPLPLIAVEINGGIWRKGGGAHTGTGHLRDMEKLNAAQKLGWKVFQFTPQQVESGEAIGFLQEVVQA